MMITFNYKNIPHQINISDEDCILFEKRFFPLNKFSILAVIPDDETEIENADIDKYLINAIEECIY